MTHRSGARSGATNTARCERFQTPNMKSSCGSDCCGWRPRSRFWMKKSVWRSGSRRTGGSEGATGKEWGRETESRGV